MSIEKVFDSIRELYGIYFNANPTQLLCII